MATVNGQSYFNGGVTVTLQNKNFFEIVHFTRPDPLPYRDEDGAEVIADTNQPRFTYTEDGQFLGLCLDSDVQEFATLIRGIWYSGQEGSWVIDGIFYNASLLGGTVGQIDGQGVLVVTLSGSLISIYFSGNLVRSIETDGRSMLSLSVEGKSLLKSVRFFQRVFTPTESESLAVNRGLYLNQYAFILRD